MDSKTLSPSIFAYDNCRIADGLEILECLNIGWVHIDVMDGSFVHNISFGQEMVRCMRRISDLFFDVHLMVHDPLSLVESFAFAGANAITFQCESVSNIGATLQKIRSTGCKAGVAIGPISLVSDIADYLDLPDLILIMSVRPGKCRQEFLPIAANKLNELRNLRKRWGLNYKISIDGGINCTTVHTAAEAGADIVVAGSAFFDDPPKFLTEMRTIARQS